MLEEILLEILEAFNEVLLMLPVLYLVYFLISLFEHKFLTKSKKFGPLLGSALGSVPQCGFSAVMSDLYSKRMITIGTLIAVFVATSDEAIPIMIANPNFIVPMLFMILIKFMAAVLFGYIIDFVMRKTKQKKKFFLQKENHKTAVDTCSCESCIKEQADEVVSVHGSNCHCDKNPFLDAFWHTLNIAAFIFIATAVINVIVYFVGMEGLAVMFGNNVYLEVLIASVVGLIPNCAASVFLVELFMNGAMSFAALLAGLSAGAGVGLLVLFNKNRKNWRENLLIVVIMFAIGVIIGIVFSFVPVWF